MKALVYHGKNDVRVDEVDMPVIVDQTDIIIKVTLTAICGSDLHLFGGLIPTTEKGDILGHEFMGEVVEVGSEVRTLKVGDRVVIPFTISCGHCFYCDHQEFSLCDNSNPNKDLVEEMMGYSPAGIFGYSHMFGGFSGGQAEYARVPHADVGALKIPSTLPDEKVLFLSDIFPTGWMAAENCQIEKGDTVAVWGAGPVGQFAIRSAFMQGAGKVIAIDDVPERLKMAQAGGADIINFGEKDVNVLEELKSRTGGRGPDCCIDAVGMEAHGHGVIGSVINAIDKAKQMVMLENDRPSAIREILRCCRKGGRVSIPGVYSGLVDNFPLGFAFNKGLSMKMGQTHVQKYMPLLLKKIEDGEIDPSFVITHRLTLDDAAKGYDIFKHKQDECIKVVLKP